MKRLTLLLGALLLTAAALAQTAVPPTVRIAHGPYVLNVTEDGFTVVWDAKADAIGWVELAPMDGSHFYSAERPRYYDSHLGLCRVGRMHRVRIEGLQPGTTYRYRIMQRGIVLNEATGASSSTTGTAAKCTGASPTPSEPSTLHRKRSISGWSTTSTPATPFSSC